MGQINCFIKKIETIPFLKSRDYPDDKYVFVETEEDNGKNGYEYTPTSDEEDE